MKTLCRKWSAVLTALVTFALVLSVAALAADQPAAADAQAQTAPSSNASQPSNSSDDGVWHWDVAPYVFMPGINGTVGVLGHNASVHLTGSDVMSNFNGGLAGYVEARKNRFVMPIDFLWARVATTQGVPLNDLGQTQIRLTQSQFIFTPKVGYRIIDMDHFKVDAVAGIRYWHEGLNLTLRPSQLVNTQAANWVDAVAGGDFRIYFTPKVWILASGDAGGGGAALDYQGLGLLNFQPKPLLGFFVGWRYLDVNYTGSKAFLYDLNQSGPMFGLNLQFGGKPPIPPSASCSIAPAAVWAGEPVTVNMAYQNFDPKHTLTFSWNSNGGKVTGSNITGNVDTTGLAPGSYTVTGTVTDPKEKKNNTASCNSSFTVNTPHPPTASCSASPDTVKAGDSSTVTVNASSPDNFPLTYAWATTAGHLNGNGTTATLDTTGATEGSTITATATVTDSRGLTASCSANVNVQAPPPVATPPQVSEVGECNFTDARRPARVDNTCKAVLDDVALRVQHEQSGNFLVVGNAENANTPHLAAQRAVNVKYYLTNGEGKSGIDASRIQPSTGTASSNTVKVYFVPSGATFSEQTTPVDETQVKGQARNAAAPRKAHKAAAPAPPAQ